MNYYELQKLNNERKKVLERWSLIGLSLTQENELQKLNKEILLEERLAKLQKLNKIND